VASAIDDKTITINPPPAPGISSAANQTFTEGDPDTLISMITITDDATTPTITAANDLRIRIPSSFNMTWDTGITTVTLGGLQAGKASPTLLAYEDGGRTLVLNVTSDFVADDQITIADPQFVSFSAASAADNLELEVNNDDVVSATDDKTITIDPDLTRVRISSVADQTFTVGDPSTVSSTFTVTDDTISARITVSNDVRIRIPVGFNMTWDTSITSVIIGGSNPSKASGTVTYEDDGRTLVVNITRNLNAGQSISVSGAQFTNFTAASPPDNLELEVDNDGVVSATDDKTIVIVAVTISSAADQTFIVGQSPTLISTQTVTDDSSSPLITAANDLRVRIPAGFNMSWDITDTEATIGGAASGKVSTTVSYEDGGQTLLLDVTADFVASDQITISDLSFMTFTALSVPDNLELEVKNDGQVNATDDKIIGIALPSISSAANQSFNVAGSPTAISVLTVTDDVNQPTITSLNDLRIRIPSGFNMTWDTVDTTATIGGPAVASVSGTVSYEDGGQTLVVDVTTDFVAGDQITISDLSYLDFTAVSAADNLELEINNDDVVQVTDDKTITINDAYGISSAANQTFIEGDPTTLISTITITDSAQVPTFTALNDLRIRIPAGFNMSWDITDANHRRHCGCQSFRNSQLRRWRPDTGP